MSTCDNCELPIEENKTDAKGLCDPCSKLLEAEPSLYVRPIVKNDLELILAWRSNPKIYQYFRRQSGPLSWNEHINWYKSRPDSRYDFIICYSGRRVGVVNINQNSMVGIYLGDLSAREQGIATEALDWLCDRFKHRGRLYADIHVENTASKRLFKKCGFKKQSREGKWITYVYTS